MKEETNSIKELKLVISSLQEQIAVLQREMSQLTHPLQKVFLAAPGDDGGWVEQTVVGGEIAEFTDGREDDEDPVDPGDGFALIEINDIVGGSKKKTYVKIGGGSGLTMCTLEHTGSDQYTARKFPSGGGTPYGTGLIPQSRWWPTGAVTVSTHAEYGAGYFLDGEFVLALAFGEKWGSGACSL